jgi:hypothetical protein
MDKELLAQQTFYAPLVINKYIEEQLRDFNIVPASQTWSPIMPVFSSSIDDLYGELINSGNTLPLVIFYDRLSRFRPSPMYRHKREQIMYTLHGSMDSVFAGLRVIEAALDREDAAAQDVNLWSSKNKDLIVGSDALTQPIFFHNFKTFQVDETRDLLELAAVRGIYRNKIIVEYDYHTNDPLDALYT